MKKFCSKVYTTAKHMVKSCVGRVKMLFCGGAATVAGTSEASAQTLSGTDYSAGESALETVATEIAGYVPYVVNLCYALAGVVAIVGAISVYIAMNNLPFQVVSFSSKMNDFEPFYVLIKY